MAEQSNAELIAAHQFDSGNCACGLPWHECSYAPYAERLEAADQRAELAEANLSVEESKNAGYRAKNNQLAAVVEKVRDIIHGPRGLTINEEKVWQIVNNPTTPADVLRELKADVWDEGEEAGMKNQENWDGWRDTKPPITNPYRKEQS